MNRAGLIHSLAADSNRLELVHAASMTYGAGTKECRLVLCLPQEGAI